MEESRWRRIEALYHAALEREPHLREHYLLAACDDEGVRKEVESLLAQNVSQEGRLDHPAWEAAPDLVGDAPAATPVFPDLTGQAIGGYRIEQKLGQGGMGVVYKARDESLGRTVAVKLPAPHLMGNEEHKRRFLREARATATLDHPNVCMVHGVGEDRGYVFLAMGFVDGIELSDKIRERPLKLDDALDIAVQAAEGLREAHRNGIVHRDVKSSNVMLTSTGQVKVMDFGLAQLADGTRLTQTGAVIGTPAYMSPEQAQRRDTDRRTDIWSLGVVLYEMVTGQLPFEGDHELSVIYSIINEPHEPITARRAGVPLELDRIVAKMLEKNPEQRYQHLDDLLVDLRALSEKPSSSSLPAAKAPQDRRTFLWAGASAVVVTAAVVAGRNLNRWLGIGGEAPRIASIAVLPLANFSGDPEQEYFSDGLTETLIASLAKIGDLRVISRRSVMQYKGATKSVGEIAGELGVDAILEGSARRVGDNVRITAQLIDASTDEHLWAETYDRAMSDVVRVQSDVARAIAERVNIELTPAAEERLADAREVNPQVYEEYLRGLFYMSRNTPEDFQEGIDHLHRAVEIDPAEPLAYLGLAEGYVTLGHGGGDWRDAFPRAKAAAERALSLDPHMTAAEGILAEVALYYEWDWEKAGRLFRSTLERNPNLPFTRYHHAWYLALFDRIDEAIEEHKRARDLDPLQPLHTGWLGLLYLCSGRTEEAVAEAERAVELDPGFPPTYIVLSWAYSRSGMHDEAIAAARKLVEIFPPLGSVFLGVALARAGRTDEARAIADALDPAGSGNHLVLFYSPQLYAALGDVERGLELLETGYDLRIPFLPWMRNTTGGLEDLWDEPRFWEIVQRMGLPGR